MANRTLKLKPAADADLISIFRYTSDEWGTRQAVRGHPVQSHIIFYRATDYGVVIIRVLHKAMDYTGHF